MPCTHIQVSLPCTHPRIHAVQTVLSVGGGAAVLPAPRYSTRPESPCAAHDPVNAKSTLTTRRQAHTRTR